MKIFFSAKKVRDNFYYNFLPKIPTSLTFYFTFQLWISVLEVRLWKYCFSGKFHCNAERFAMPWATAPSMVQRHPDNDCASSATPWPLPSLTNTLVEAMLRWLWTLKYRFWFPFPFKMPLIAYTSAILFSFDLIFSIPLLIIIHAYLYIIRNQGREAQSQIGYISFLSEGIDFPLYWCLRNRMIVSWLEILK